MSTDIFESEEVKQLYMYSIRLISRQDYSPFKLRKKLVSKITRDQDKEIAISNIEKTINIIVKKNLINEEEYTRLKVIALAKKCLHETQIIKTLEAEEISISQDQITRILEDERLSTFKILNDYIIKFVNKKKINFDDFKSKNKVFFHFCQKGHQFTDIQDLINQISKN